MKKYRLTLNPAADRDIIEKLESFPSASLRYDYIRTAIRTLMKMGPAPDSRHASEPHRGEGAQGKMLSSLDEF